MMGISLTCGIFVFYEHMDVKQEVFPNNWPWSRGAEEDIFEMSDGSTLGS